MSEIVACIGISIAVLCVSIVASSIMLCDKISSLTHEICELRMDCNEVRMMRLIDADELPLDIEREDIDDAPTVDAVEVVRCKDCKWYVSYTMENKTYKMCRKAHLGSDDFYCADGERKSE